MSAYKLLAAGNFKKVEQFGHHVVERTSYQAAWPLKTFPKADCFFLRNDQKKGWQGRGLSSFEMEVDDVKVEIRFTDFGHLGLFPEHIQLADIVASLKPKKILNLFAYTGYLSLKASLSGASVTHVDASKASIEWAKKNASLNQITDIRWICEDVQKFVKRQLRKNESYDYIVLDPPSFGRGTKNEIWKIEEHLFTLMEDLKGLRSDDFKGILLSSHSEGYTPIVLKNILESCGYGSTIDSGELTLQPEQTQFMLPCGAYARC